MSIIYTLITRNTDCCLVECANAKGNYKLLVLEFLNKFNLNNEKNYCSVVFKK